MRLYGMPTSALRWRDYYIKRWETLARRGVDPVFSEQMALFYQFMAHLHGELPDA